MVTADGSFVVAQANEAAFEALVGKTRVYHQVDERDIPPELKCGVCSGLLRDTVSLPCCGARYCDECARTQLLDNPDATMRFRCPGCKADQFPDNLVVDSEMRKKVEEFVKELGKKGKRAREDDEDEKSRKKI